jgi:Putative Actinobacterial Holin-X, holin superfamily III
MPFDGIRNSALVRTITDVLEAFPDLFRKELRLALAEFSEKIKDGVTASVWMIVAGFLALISFFILIEAAIFGVASLGLALHWSCLIVAAVIGAAAAGAFFYGHSTMPDTLVPARSVREINEDIRTVKEQLT